MKKVLMPVDEPKASLKAADEAVQQQKRFLNYHSAWYW